MGMKEDIFGYAHDGPKINVKKKGDKNELRLTKILARWTGTEFTRVPRSGGLRWQNVMNNICGDVVCTNPFFYFPFSIETKDISNIRITQELRKNSVIFRYWKQAKRDSLRAKRIPLMFIRCTNERPKEKYTIFLEPKRNVILLLGRKKVPIISKGYEIKLIGINSITFFDHVLYEEFASCYK